MLTVQVASSCQVLCICCLPSQLSVVAEVSSKCVLCTCSIINRYLYLIGNQMLAVGGTLSPSPVRCDTASCRDFPVLTEQLTSIQIVVHWIGVAAAEGFVFGMCVSVCGVGCFPRP